MTDPQQAQRIVLDSLRDHFDRTPEYLEVPQIVEMIGLGEATVQNALRRLWESGRIEGVDVAELRYPVQVTRVIG